MRFTATKIKYLITLVRLNTDNSEIQFTQLCSEIKLTKGSVHRMLDFLREMNIIYKTPDSKIRLTQEGYEIGQHYYDQFKALKKHFTEQYRLENDEVDKICFALLENLTDDSITKIMSKIK